MNRLFPKIAAVLAFVIGAMAVFAGGSVLLGRDPGYYVINWLPIYNFGMGLLTMAITAILIWRGHKYALPAAWTTGGAHTLVLLILLARFSDVVAADSLRAMTVRIVVWLAILGLLMWQKQQDRSPRPG